MPIDSKNDRNAFVDRSLTNIHLEIPNTVSYGGSIYTVTVIGYQAFRGSGIKTAKIPRFVTTILDYAFDWCQQMTKIEFDADSLLTNVGNSFCVGALIRSIRLPASVAVIKSQIFTKAYNLEKIYFAGGLVACSTNLSSVTNITINVLPNYPSQYFCSKPVTIINKLPSYHPKSCRVSGIYMINMMLLLTPVITIS